MTSPEGKIALVTYWPSSWLIPCSLRIQDLPKERYSQYPSQAPLGHDPKTLKGTYTGFLQRAYTVRNIFDKSLYFKSISFKSKFLKILLFYIAVIFIHLYNIFAVDLLKIFSVLNSDLPGPGEHGFILYSSTTMKI